MAEVPLGVQSASKMLGLRPWHSCYSWFCTQEMLSGLQSVSSICLDVLTQKSLPRPVTMSAAGPTNFGPTAEAGTPWLQLALYTAMAQGPLTVVLVCGQRLWRLPPHLASCTHVLVWPWDLESVRAQTSPVMLESAFLLFSLNEYLSRTAVMVQPLNLPEGSDVATLSAVQIPLPPLSKGSMLQGRQTSPSLLLSEVMQVTCTPCALTHPPYMFVMACMQQALCVKESESV